MPRRLLIVFCIFACSLTVCGPVSAAGRGRPGKPPPKPSLVPPGWPKLIIIPRFKIKAPIEPIAFTRKSDYYAPYKWGDVAWYSRGPRPGDQGRANFFGHLDSYCCPAVFYLLKDLKKGDTVQVAYKTGHVLNFRVQWSVSYPNNHLPTKFLFGSTRERGVDLMTCAGLWHLDGTGYDHKLVVYARLILPNGKLG